jgi:hypothetical protein
MDCDKFDSVLLDLLYDELDQLTRASAQRHADQCQRCRDVLAGFRATRESTRIPLVELPDGFESRVLEAERAVRRELPFRVRLARTLTIASGYAMRPQLAMAALLLLVVGASLAVLRPKPGSHGSVQVTEHGAPQSERELVVPVEEGEDGVALAEPSAPPLKAAAKAEETVAVAANTAAPSDAIVDDQARAEAEDRAYAAAMEAYRGGDHETAQRQFDAIVQSGGRNANAAELYAAFAAEKALGCSAALPRFDSVAAKNESNDLGHQATWQSATCRAQVGEDARARRDLENLERVPSYAQRARAALDRLGTEGRDQSLVASRRADDKSAAADQVQAPGEGAADGTSTSSAPVAGTKSAGPPKVAAAPRASSPASKAAPPAKAGNAPRATPKAKPKQRSKAATDFAQ